MLLIIIWFKSKRGRSLPGPGGAPLLGYLPWLDPLHPYKTLTQLSEKYGSVFSVMMGSVECVVVSDNKIIRELFSRDELTGRPPLYMFARIMEARGIIFSEAETWREQRKFAGLAMKKVGLIGSGLNNWLSKTIKEMVDLFGEVKDRFIDPHEVINHVVGNMMNEAIFSKRYSPNDSTWRYLQEISKEGNKRFGTLAAVNFLPFLKYWPSVQNNIRYIKNNQSKQFDQYEKLTQAREDHLDAGNDPECLTDYYLQEMKRRQSSGDAGSFTRRQLYFFQGDMFGAGTETSINTVMFSLMFLSSQEMREYQERIQEEIDHECGDSAPTTHHSLSLLRAVVLEIQRLRPVTPQGVPHGVLSPVTAGHITLAPGTMVMPLHWAANHDPSHWSDPDTFKPERFLDSDGTLITDTNIFPFQVKLIFTNNVFIIS